VTTTTPVDAIMSVDVGGIHPASIVVTAVLCTAAVTLVIVAWLWFYHRRKQKRKTEFQMKSATQKLL